MATSFVSDFDVRPVTSGTHHFFGYYDKSPWDHTGRWMLGLESEFKDHPPTAADSVTVGLIDTQADNRWTPLARSLAWNWQQSCMLQWLNGGRSHEILFNDRAGDHYVTRILNLKTGRERVLERPSYGVNRAGTFAVSVNFSRLHHQRPGYGYAGVPDPWQNVNEPEDDGVFRLNLATGESKLILSTRQAACFQRSPEFEGKVHRFNHLQFGANHRRFAMLHRYKTPDEEVGHTRLLTMDLDGTDLRCLSDHGLVSHYDWRGGDAILAWATRRGIGDRYFLFQEDGSGFKAIGEDVFNCDGHCSFSPDNEWILTDTYPDAEHFRTLIVYHCRSGKRIDLGRFLSPPVEWQIRCDLHPRWSRDGRTVCFDSVHEGVRQMYVIDVAGLVKRLK